MEENQYYLFDEMEIVLVDFKTDGFILDIGGGGEGIIGRLKGRDVIAIDIRRDELMEAPAGPLKIVMDARDLTFPDDSFNQSTAFFSLMYLKTREDQLQVFQEIHRVLKPGGSLYIWDLVISGHPATAPDIYIVPLWIRVAGDEIRTGYGNRWKADDRSSSYYLALAEETGFRQVKMESDRHIMHLVLEKV